MTEPVSLRSLAQQLRGFRELARTGGLDVDEFADDLDACRASLGAALQTFIERACRFNCDAESACNCWAHEAYRDLRTRIGASR